MDLEKREVVVIGAGPAGLTAGYELTKYQLKPLVIEQQARVGGIARTEEYKGYHFDMGGHRFFTKDKGASQMWEEFLGEDFLLRPRLSRIYYNNKFFYYPLKYFNALFGLGIWQAILVVLSYIQWQIFPYPQEDTFEQWVTNRFGKRLFETFFKTYTEKIWGIPCTELKAEWAAQRIKDLSLRTALMSMFIKPGNTIKTLIEEFNYPRLGPGMLWERVRQEIERQGGAISLNTTVTKIHRDGNCITAVEIVRDGKTEVIPGSVFVSTMPVSEFIQKLDTVPGRVLHAAQQLHYRDFMTVCLIVNKERLFPDNWIYVHSPGVKVGRIQNFKNWSPDMVPDPSKTSLGMEYFCTEGDELWSMTDTELVELGKREIDRIGLAQYADVEDGCVFRVPKAYPVYDSEYHEYLEIVKEFIGSLENFQTIGRNGLHRYNNQDHSMITARLGVRNLILGEKNDVWSINGEQEYHETIHVPAAEERSIDSIFTASLTKVFSRLDPVAMGLSLGVTASALLFLATIFLVIKGGPVIGPNLALLANFFPGYQVNFVGGLIGLAYGLGIGFLTGWGIAYLHNLTVYLSANLIHRDLEMNLMRRFLDFM